jgi:ribosome biogenesis GTPase
MTTAEGIISFVSVNRFRIMTRDGERMAVLGGMDGGMFPAVGDVVDFLDNPSGDCVIKRIHERKTRIARKTSGREFKETVIAANVDIMLIVTALDRNFKLRRIERFLVLAASGGVLPVVVLTKSDICDPVTMAVAMSDMETAGDVRYFMVSAVTGEGMAELEAVLTDGVTACAVGLSGAGKSTLLNRLTGGEAASTGGVRADDDKGRHTTTGRQLYRLPSGAMFIDTPGLREIGLTGDQDALDDVFDDITSYADGCAFSDCSHMHEPGCAVLAAVESGDISEERYKSYIKLTLENESYLIRANDPQKKKRQDKILSKMVKSVTKQKKRF